MSSDIQECGTCNWFKPLSEHFGWCMFPLPKLPLYVPLYREASWRDVTENDGEGCPTYEVKVVL